MIRYAYMRPVATNKNGNTLENIEYFEGYCTHADEKPIRGIANGSNLLETDTGDIYFFNEDSGTWVIMA